MKKTIKFFSVGRFVFGLILLLLVVIEITFDVNGIKSFFCYNNAGSTFSLTTIVVFALFIILFFTNEVLKYVEDHKND